MALFTILGFSLGLAFDGIVGKAYAKTETPATNIKLPEGADFEVMSTGTARSAYYEIVYIYKKKAANGRPPDFSLLTSVFFSISSSR